MGQSEGREENAVPGVAGIEQRLQSLLMCQEVAGEKKDGKLSLTLGESRAKS